MFSVIFKCSACCLHFWGNVSHVVLWFSMLSPWLSKCFPSVSMLLLLFSSSLLNLSFPNFSTFLARCFDIAHTFSVTPHFALPPSAHKTEWNLLAASICLLVMLPPSFIFAHLQQNLSRPYFFCKCLPPRRWWCWSPGMQVIGSWAWQA